MQDLDEEEDVDEAANSEAPDADLNELNVVEEQDQGTEDTSENTVMAGGAESNGMTMDENCDFFGGDCEMFDIYRWIMQWVNVAGFIVMIAMNSVAQSVLPYSLGEVTEDWNLPIDPAGYAFSIWGLIYFLLALFTIYQAIPSVWLQELGITRSDEVIFFQMNGIFLVNTLLNAAWLPLFQSNTLWGFIVGWVFLIGIWLTNTALMVISQRNEMMWYEVLLVRLPMSVYSGWVTGACVLNTAYMLKSWGMADDPNRNKKFSGISEWSWAQPLMFISEEEWTVIALWAVEIFNEIVSWWERNPAWGSVYTWATAAILVKNVQEKPENTTLIPNVGTIVGVHAISQGILFCYLIFEQLQPWYEPFEFWNGGLFGLVDWSRAFREIRQVLSYPEKYLNSLTEREFVA